MLESMYRSRWSEPKTACAPSPEKFFRRATTTVSAGEACEGYQVAGTMRFIMLHELLPASPCIKAATTHKENDQKDY